MGYWEEYYGLLKDLTNKVGDLQDEWKKKRLECPILEYAPGDLVWVCHPSETLTAVCPTCSGTGMLTREFEGELYKRTCPKCGGHVHNGVHKKSTYTSFISHQTKVESVYIEVNANYITYSYKLIDLPQIHDGVDVFSTKEACDLRVGIKNEISKQAALKKTGNIV